MRLIPLEHNKFRMLPLKLTVAVAEVVRTQDMDALGPFSWSLNKNLPWLALRNFPTYPTNA